MCAVLWVLCALRGEKEGSASEEPAFERAIAPREFSYPKDFGAHPAYKTEWWYLTGALKTEQGEEVGFQATWFRSGLTPQAPARVSALAPRDLFLFHGACTDVAKQSFLHDHAACRGASTWAGAETGGLKVFLLGRTLERGADGSWRVRFEVQGRAFDLTMTPEREPLLHGESPGLSLKGPEPGEASYYVSVPRLRTSGTFQREPGGAKIKVEGLAWFDQEFGSGQLGKDQVGWDWFSAQLDDGADLMLYQLRKEDGSVEPKSSGTLRAAGGERTHLKRDDYRIEVLETWTSPRTKDEKGAPAKYPAKWKLTIPSRRVELIVTPLLPGQELTTPGTTGVNYWEGLCRFEGTVGDKKVSGRGYVELVGYAGRFLKGI
ncbi:MAG: carotenoid 1,2-hydratase [Planctomycetota bacterium]|nr:carotenoid 1,2-hydratase [Planctomycetota bacterium]